ncbi:MAG TPA: YbaB/EbfC family nucleoid-associated protein [Gemmatimonadales bacterium]
MTISDRPTTEAAVLADPTRISQRESRPDAGRADAELAGKLVTADAGAGLVRATVDGRGALQSLVIAPEAFNGRDADLLADLVMAAIAEAQRRLDDHG